MNFGALYFGQAISLHSHWTAIQHDSHMNLEISNLASAMLHRTKDEKKIWALLEAKQNKKKTSKKVQHKEDFGPFFFLSISSVDVVLDYKMSGEYS